MPVARATTALALTGAALAAAALAPLASDAADPKAKAAKDKQITSSKLLWATVNVCDTKSNPNTIGIRASMPGSGVTAEQMYVRFQVQYLSPTDHAWHNFATGSGDFGKSIGSGKYKARQAGQNFTITVPAGRSYTLRGAVTYEWRHKGSVVRRARKSTTAGHKGTTGADPADYTAATCVIK